MEEQLLLGRRIRRWRIRRGLSQEALAALAGITQSYLSKIEAGTVVCDRRSILAALAVALSVSVGDLVGQPGDPTSPAKIMASASVPLIRAAIVCRRVEGARREPAERGACTVADALHAIQASDYTALGPMLPGLIATGTGPELVQTGYAAMYHLRRLGHEDLARDIAAMTLEEAPDDIGPTWVGLANYVYASSLPAETPAAARLTATRAADRIQHALADGRTRQAYGMLHLTAALRAATENRADTALEHLAEASAEADSLGEPPADGLCGLMFGPTNVLLWKLAIMQELGRPDEAIAVARAMDPRGIAQVQRRGAYWRDFGAALTATGQDDQAVVAFVNAEAVCPQPFRLLPEMRENVECLAHRARRRALNGALGQLTEIFALDYEFQE